jgi:predicted Zn-dependent protease
MSDQEAKYFDLLTAGLGYINRVRDVTPEEGNPFTSVTLAALRGSADNAQYTHFECRVAGKQAKAVVRELQAAVEGDHKVLVGFTLSDLYAEAFTYKKGEKAGETGISLKARLLRIGWAKIDGEPIEIEQATA